MKFKLVSLFYDCHASGREESGRMKASARVVLMYLALTVCLGLMSLCAGWAR